MVVTVIAKGIRTNANPVNDTQTKISPGLNDKRQYLLKPKDDLNRQKG